VAATVDRRGQVGWPEKLRAWVEGMAAAYFDLQPLHDVLFHDSADREAVSEYRVVRHLIELLCAGTSAGAWNIADPKATAVVIFCGLHGAVEDALLAGVPRAQVAKTVAPLFLRMVGTDQ
jgi:hypothetical protein